MAADVCDVLGIRTDAANQQLEDDEKAQVSLPAPSSNGVSQNRRVSVISLPGLYALIMRSRKERTRKFRRWVTPESPAASEDPYLALR